MEQLGFPPTPWQQHVLDVALEVEELAVFDGEVLIRTEQRFFYREVRLWVPRQSGKTSLILGVLLHRCLAWPDQRVVYTAQTRNHARAKFVEEHLPILELSPFASLFNARLSNGSEHVLFRKSEALPSRWGIDSTTKKAGHGPTLDMVMADEFFAQEDDRLESGARPTMITRRQPQMWFVSTFGDDEDGATMGAPLWAKVDDSRDRCRRFSAGDPDAHGRVCSFEWSAADVDETGIDYGDINLWRATMPALECNGGIIREDAIRADFESMPLAAFKRAYLNLRPKRNAKPQVIPPDKWNDAIDLDSAHVGMAAFGFDVGPDGEDSSLSIVGRRADGKWHADVLESPPGTAGLVERVVEAIAAADAAGQFAALGYLPGTAAASFVPDIVDGLLAKGVKLGEGKTSRIVKISGQSYMAACGSVYEAVVNGDDFRHLNQPRLNAAVAGVARKTIGDAWVWDRREWTTDITPICSVTTALRAYQLAPEPKDDKSSYSEERGMRVLG